MFSQPAIDSIPLAVDEDNAFAPSEEKLGLFHDHPYSASQKAGYSFLDPEVISCPIPSVKCQNCDTEGIEVYVIKGKICPRCGAHCG